MIKCVLVLSVIGITLTSSTSWAGKKTIDNADSVLQKILSQAQSKATGPLSTQGWGVYVQALDQGKDNFTPILSHKADQLLNPASLMKLLTTAVALDQFGSAHTFKTQVWKKNDNLYFKGGGDPYLTIEQMWLMLRHLRGRGLSNIRGDIVLDRSGYEVIADDPAAFDNDPKRAYNAPPNPLLVNFHALTVRFIPDVKNDSVQVVTTPSLEGLRITKPRLQKNSAACGDWRAQLKMNLPKNNRGSLDFAGSYAASCGEQSLNIYPYFLSPNDYFSALFQNLWGEMGGQWKGQVVDGTVPVDAELIYEHESQAMSNVIRAINKYSNNVMARQLFLNLSAPDLASGSAPVPPVPASGSASEMKRASLHNSAQKILTWMDARQLPRNGIVPDNGAGLSRISRISPLQMAHLLRWMYQSAMMPDFLSSLPRLGVDGSLKSRLKNQTVSGSAYLKTGRLDNVSGVAGYVLSARGQWYVVVSILNQEQAELKTAVHDALVQWVYEQ